jgi:hypothetical protein
LPRPIVVNRGDEERVVVAESGLSVMEVVRERAPDD